ncbi:MAG: hypothetical protein ACKVOR_13545 [Flavobacteriales bacterium]
MVQIALNLDGKTASEKCDVGEFVHDQMTLNAAKFVTPPIAMGAFATMITDTRNAISRAEQGTQADRAARDAQEELLVETLEELAVYVELTAKNDEAWALLSGFELRKDPTPIGPLGQVQNLKSITTNVVGEIKLKWKVIYGARTYVVQVSDNPTVETGWTQAGIASRAQQIVNGLPSLTRKYFRVAAIGAAGQGPWSDIVEGFAR